MIKLTTAELNTRNHRRAMRQAKREFSLKKAKLPRLAKQPGPVDTHTGKTGAKTRSGPGKGQRSTQPFHHVTNFYRWKPA